MKLNTLGVPSRPTTRMGCPLPGLGPPDRRTQVSDHLRPGHFLGVWPSSCGAKTNECRPSPWSARPSPPSWARRPSLPLGPGPPWAPAWAWPSSRAWAGSASARPQVGRAAAIREAAQRAAIVRSNFFTQRTLPVWAARVRRLGSCEPPTRLRPVWRERRAAHEERVDDWLAPHLRRRAAGRPIRSRTSSSPTTRTGPRSCAGGTPAPGVVLAGVARPRAGPDYAPRAAGATLDTAAVLARRGDSMRLDPRAAGPHGRARGRTWAASACTSGRWSTGRPRRGTPQRLAAAALARSDRRVVRGERGVRCSHFDAYRFFTAPARPLNVLRPTREAQHDAGAAGLPARQHGPLQVGVQAVARWSPSELVADCFALARDIRDAGHARQPVRPGGAGLRAGADGDPRGPGRVRARRSGRSPSAPLRCACV